MDDLKKPLPVVIVEAIAWMYVMLSALLFVCAIVNACRDGGESLSGILFVFLYGLCLARTKAHVLMRMLGASLSIRRKTISFPSLLLRTSTLANSWVYRTRISL